MTRLHIKNGRIIDPANKLDEVGDLFVADGKIISIKIFLPQLVDKVPVFEKMSGRAISPKATARCRSRIFWTTQRAIPSLASSFI